MPTLPTYGTLTTFDTLRSSNQTIAQFGEDRAWDAINAALAAHNEILDTLITDLVQKTTDRLERFGTPATMKMVEVDELGVADAQKIGVGTNVGFPLRKFEASLQWSYDYFRNATATEIAGQATAMFDADVVNLIYQIKKCLFTPISYTSDDRFVDHLATIQLPIKPLLNGDGQPIPIGPNGETFNASTHTHYILPATPGTFTEADAVALINHVAEHFRNGQLMVYINRGAEGTWKAFQTLNKFAPYVDVRVIQPNTVAYAGGQALDLVNINNRAIGVYMGAEVWVKPWIPAGYALAFMKGQPKPVRMREQAKDEGVLRLVFEDEDHPLRAKVYQRMCGFGVYQRDNGVIMDQLNGTWTIPAL